MTMIAMMTIGTTTTINTITTIAGEMTIADYPITLTMSKILNLVP